MKEAILCIRQLDDGRFEYRDSRGVHYCQPNDLGREVQAILANPNLEPVQVTMMGGDDLVGACLHNLAPPQLQRFVGPGMRVLDRIFTSLEERQQAAAATRYEDAPRRASPPDPPSPSERRRAHRRGTQVVG